jgi:hypothetical protein
LPVLQIIYKSWLSEFGRRGIPVYNIHSFNPLTADYFMNILTKNGRE